MSAPEYHEKWCGINCYDCGRRCTCPRQEKTVLHPHYAVPKTPEECPSKRHHHAMASCGYCDYRSTTIGLWTTPTTSSGRFDDAKRTLNADLGRAKREDTGWSDADKRLASVTFLALLELACLIYLSVRGVR